MEPLAALSPRASRWPAKPDTDGVATTLPGGWSPGSLATAQDVRRRATPQGLSAGAKRDFRGFRMQNAVFHAFRTSYAMPAIASRTIQMPVRSWTWVWMRFSPPA